MSVTETFGALYRFFEGFGLPVYAEGDAPARARPPYITVRLVAPGWEQTAGFMARLWYRGPRLDDAARMADAIGETIGPGTVLSVEGGAVWIYRDAPFAQFMPFEADPMLKCVVLRLKVQALVA